MSETDAIKELYKREDIIITNADKVGVLFIVDTKDYINQAKLQLKYKDTYHILPQDPTLGYNKLVNLVNNRLKIEKLVTDKITD